MQLNVRNLSQGYTTKLVFVQLNLIMSGYELSAGEKLKI